MSAILNSLCRLCAKPNEQLLFLQKEMVHQISLMFEMHIGQFDNDDTPKRICRRCRCIVLNSWNFFKQMHAAQKFFTDFFFSADENIETIVICPQQTEIRETSIENLQKSKNTDENNSIAVKIDSNETSNRMVLDSENNSPVTKRSKNKLKINENANCNKKIIRKECYRTNSYSCSICDKTFDDEDCLKNHIRDHNRAKPFKCYLCSFRYNDLPYWHRHLRNIHGVVFKLTKNQDSKPTFPENYVEKRPKYKF